VTPQEIAVSILAELIGVKYGKIAEDASESGAETVNSLRWTPLGAPQATSA
jgi:xanthine/CO dehydrogenase XdhC/CoxF family maturation factor